MPKILHAQTSQPLQALKALVFMVLSCTSGSKLVLSFGQVRFSVTESTVTTKGAIQYVSCTKDEILERDELPTEGKEMGGHVYTNSTRLVLVAWVWRWPSD